MTGDLSYRVIQAIADELAVDEMDVSPLTESTDPDALEELATYAGTTIEFVHDGVVVTIVVCETGFARVHTERGASTRSFTG